MKKNSHRCLAASACVIVLALIVGPACAGLCAGANCIAGAAKSSEASGCHHEGHERGGQFSHTANMRECSADASFAIASKPTAGFRAGNSHSQERVPAVVYSAFSRTNLADSSFVLYPEGCSPGILTAKPASSILRV